jgi:hypothetical protein
MPRGVCVCAAPIFMPSLAAKQRAEKVAAAASLGGGGGGGGGRGGGGGNRAEQAGASCSVSLLDYAPLTHTHAHEPLQRLYVWMVALK